DRLPRNNKIKVDLERVSLIRCCKEMIHNLYADKIHEKSQRDTQGDADSRQYQTFMRDNPGNLLFCRTDAFQCAELLDTLSGTDAEGVRDNDNGGGNDYRTDNSA